MFINFNVIKGVFVTTYAQPEGYLDDLTGLLQAVSNGGPATVCPLAGAKDALCDGEYLGKVNASQWAVEAVYDAIQNSELQADDQPDDY